MCPLQKLGTVPADTLDCLFYCDYLERAVQKELTGGCSSDWDCRSCELTTLDLLPTPGVLCEPVTQYALYSSCVIPSTSMAAFTSRVDEILRRATNRTCPQARLFPPVCSVFRALSADFPATGRSKFRRS